MAARSLVLPMALALLVLPALAPPAAANHDLNLLHEPPPAAVAHQDLRLAAVVVTNCGLISCQSISVALRYTTPDGLARSQSASVPHFPGAQPVVFTIPAAQLGPGMLTYWLQASQTECPIGGWCHSDTARAPAQGTYAVPVVGL